jgi:hypothetical protein
MTDFGPALTDDQWNRIRQVVHDEALRARVAASFLPLYGPLPGDATNVPVDTLTYKVDGEDRLAVNDYDTIRLARIAVNVFIKNHMLADPELAAASIMFRRAANIVARLEDAIIFNGRDKNKNPPIPGAEKLPPVFTVSGADVYKGLTQQAGNKANPVLIKKANPPDPQGPPVFKAVVEAINLLEGNAYYKPYACVLSDDLYTAIYEPIPSSMVLPADSIPPILNGPLLRSSALADGVGLVISLQGNPVEIVVGSDISVRYLQGTEHGDRLFRVSERFVLRVKDRSAIALLKLDREAQAERQQGQAQGEAAQRGQAQGEAAQRGQAQGEAAQRGQAQGEAAQQGQAQEDAAQRGRAQGEAAQRGQAQEGEAAERG